VVGVAELTGFESFGISLLQLLDIDVFQVRLWRRGEADASGLEELNDFAGIAVDGPMGLVVEIRSGNGGRPKGIGWWRRRPKNLAVRRDDGERF
jgi:hypothetical protein